MKNEIESLKLAEIDVEELEYRIELGQMMPMVDGPLATDCVDFNCFAFTCDTLHPE